MLVFFFILCAVFACDKKEEFVPEVSNYSIERNNATAEDFSIPYADPIELKSYLSNPKVVDFEFVRKIALLELKETGFIDEMNWTGCRLSKVPVLVLDLKSEPRFYDFIVLDTENKAIGTARLNATNKTSSVIESLFTQVFDYSSALTKAGNNASFFIDWKGEEFVGLKSKAGQSPNYLLSLSSEESVSQGDMQELEGVEIIDYMEEHVLPQLVTNDERAFEEIPEALLVVNDEDFMEELELAKTVTVEVLRDSMEIVLERTQKEAEAYWATLSEHEKALLEADDEEILNDTKFFGRLLRRVFSKTDRGLKSIKRYDDKNKQKYRSNEPEDWCGPWACGFIVYVNQGVDKYDFFESCASTFGELGFYNIMLNIFGKPLTPVEMAWSMPIASNGRIWINPLLCFADVFAYDQIKTYDKPAIRLCGTKGSLHWTLAYGAKQTGSYLWRNYYFLQIDNGVLIKEKGNSSDASNYTKVQWWNPWLMVWD